jgi:hypothetical protein
MSTRLGTTSDRARVRCRQAWRSVVVPLVAVAAVTAGGVATSTPAEAATAPHRGSVWFTSAAPSNGVVGGTITVTAAVRKPYQGVIFVTENPRVCILDGVARADNAQSWSQRITMVGPGTCTIDVASPSEDDDTDSAATVQSFPVSSPVSRPVHPASIWFTTAAPTNAAVGTWVTVKAGVRKPYDGAIFVAEDPRVCTLDGAARAENANSWSQRIKLVGPGTCTVDVDNASGEDDSDSAATVQSFTVKRFQIIQNAWAPIKTVVVGQHETISPRGGGSGNPVVAAINPLSGAGVCTITTIGRNVDVRFVKPGYCRIDFNQAGNGSYLLSPTMSRTYTVAKAPQTITFTSDAPTTTVAGDTFLPSYATGGGSGNPVRVHVEGQSDSCYWSAIDYAIHFLAAGTCAVHVTQAGNASYLDAPEVVRNVTVINPWADGAFDSGVNVIGR